VQRKSHFDQERKEFVFVLSTFVIPFW